MYGGSKMNVVNSYCLCYAVRDEQFSHFGALLAYVLNQYNPS
jgi:hypothetical protein